MPASRSCRILLLALAAPMICVATHAQQVATAVADGEPQLTASELAAANALEQSLRGDPYADEAEQQIKELLGSDSDALVWRAARAAGRLRMAEAEIVKKLQQAAQHDNWLVQLHGIAALGRSGDKSDETIDVLTAAALSDNSRVAVAAIAALKNLQVDPEKLASVVNKVLAGDNQAVAMHAVEAMVEAGPKAVPLLKAALKQPNAAFWACVAIADIGPEAAATTPEIAAFLRSNDRVESAPQALLALAEIGTAAQSAEAAVLDTMSRWSNDTTVQLSGSYALGAIGATGAQQVLEQGTESDDAFVAMVAAWALAKTNPGNDTLTEQAVERLVAGLKSDNQRMGQAAAHGLATLDIPTGMAAPYLMQAASDPEVRDHVVQALASLGPELLPHASRALANPDTRELAIDVLNELGSDAAGATEALALCLNEGDPQVCQRVNLLLARFGPQAAAATDALVAELDSDQAAVRHSAMYALREIGPAASAAKDALLARIAAADASTPDGRFDRLAAAWTLARLAPNDPRVAQAILPIVSDGLTSPQELDRMESIAAAADLGALAKPLKPQLEKLAESDPAVDVREAAVEVLAGLE